MSWSIEEHIGEGRPWPEQVVVYRGETDESLTYARRSLSDVNKMVELMDTLAAENAKLREELDAAKHDLSLFSERIVELGAENAKLREQIHWLKQGDILHVLTDQEYIDQCERERLMQVSIDALDKENAKLRELVRDMWHLFTEHGAVNQCDLPVVDAVRDRMRELGIEVEQ